MLAIIFAAFAGVLAVMASPVAKRDFGPVNIFVPPSSYRAPRTMYGRQLLLGDSSGTLLTTWENYDFSVLPYFQIYRSTDHGYTWSKLSEVHDTQNKVGLPYQPFLYLLPQAIGGYPKGTILLAGNSANVTGTGESTSTQLELYASKDNGRVSLRCPFEQKTDDRRATWSFVSHITPRAGGTTGQTDPTPVWEPFLMVYNNQLICYYSDERDPSHNQKLVYQATSDLKTWGAVTNVVAESDSNARPGMATVSKIPNGYFMSYELCNPPSGTPGCAAAYRIASNPLQFQSAQEQIVTATDGYIPTSSPYSVWTSIGSSSGATANGAIVLNAYSSGDLFINRNLGQGQWTRLSTSSPGQYSRSLGVGFNPKDIVIVGGGPFNGDGSQAKVTIVARDVNGCATC